MPQLISFGVINTTKKQEQVFIRRPKKVQVHRGEENRPFLSLSKATTKAFRVRTFSFSLQGFLWEKPTGRQTPQLMIVLQWSAAEVFLRASKASDNLALAQVRDVFEHEKLARPSDSGHYVVATRLFHHSQAKWDMMPGQSGTSLKYGQQSPQIMKTRRQWTYWGT